MRKGGGADHVLQSLWEGLQPEQRQVYLETGYAQVLEQVRIRIRNAPIAKLPVHSLQRVTYLSSFQLTFVQILAGLTGWLAHYVRLQSPQAALKIFHRERHKACLAVDRHHRSDAGGTDFILQKMWNDLATSDKMIFINSAAAEHTEVWHLIQFGGPGELHWRAPWTLSAQQPKAV